MKNIFREIKWFFQRGKRGWADCDTWSLDHYITSWMPEALKYFKENCHGYPANISREEWDNILKEMILGFKADREKDNLMDSYIFHKDVERYKKLIDEQEEIRTKGMNLFVKYYNDLWD